MHPLLLTQPVDGGCDVLIFHPRHDLTTARLQQHEVLDIISQWIAIYERRGKQEGIKYVQIFEVSGIQSITKCRDYWIYSSRLPLRIRVQLWAAQIPIPTVKFGPYLKSL